MATLATTPTYPVPTRPSLVVFSFDNGLSNYLRAWCTVAPEGSELADRIAAARLNRALVYQDEGGTKHPWRFTFDKGGKYTLVVQEYQKGNHWGGGYEGDARGAPTETKIGSETTLTLYVAQRLTQELGVGSDRATLVLYVYNDTIIETTLATHGEKTPDIIDWTSPRAETAGRVAIALSAATNIVGSSTAVALQGSTTPGSLGATVDAAISSFVAHAAATAYHEIGDAQVDLGEDYTGATSLEGIARALNKLRTRLGQHMLNSKENVPANPEYALPGGIDLHVEGTLRFDLKNALLPITASANSPSTIYAALADFWRAYELHREAAMHDAPDTVNALFPLDGVALVHKEFMSQLALLSPTAQPGQSAGAARLIGQGGFVEA